MLRELWELLFRRPNKRKFKTVTYAFPLVFVTVLFAGLAAVITGNQSYVSITSDSKVVARDQEFFITVKVTAHVPVNAVDLVIAYPESKMIVDSIDTGTSVITLWTEEPYAKNGNIYLRGGTFRKGFVGEHTIARIRVHATEAGEARLSLKSTELIAGDGQGTEVQASKADENNTVVFVYGEDGLISGEVEITFVTDIDGNGSIDLADISAFMAAWFIKDKIYDFDGDGRMTFRDFSILLADSFFN